MAGRKTQHFCKGLMAVAVLAIAVSAQGAMVIFDQATVGGTGDLGVTSITLNNAGGLAGVDLTVSGEDPAGTAANLGHEQKAGNAATGLNVDGIGVAPNAVSGTQGSERLTVSFSEEVFIEQIVLQSVGRNDDQMKFTGLADNFVGTIALSFDTLGTQGIDAIATFNLNTADPVVNANANTGDGNGMDVEGGGGFANALVINFDTPVNSDGFVFSADMFGGSAQGVGIRSITFSEVPEPASLALMGLGVLLVARRRS